MDDYKSITPKISKQPVKYRNYVTGADEEAIKEIILSASTITVEVVDGKQQRHIKVDATAGLKQERVLIERFVTEVNGSTAGMVEAIYNMRREDKKEIIDELNKLIKPIMDEIEGTGGTDQKKA